MTNRANESIRNSGREGWLLLVMAALILLIFFVKLFAVLRPGLDKTGTAIIAHHAIKLQAGIDKELLKKIIADGNYYSDSRDIDLLADSLTQKLAVNGAPDNLGALNKNSFSILAPLQWNANIGGEDFRDRLTASRQRLGFDSALYVQELTQPANYAASVQPGGAMQISGRVETGNNSMPGVLVQVIQHIAAADDSVSSIITYTRTDNNGNFVFNGLLKDSGYSVLPLKPGFEFGSSRGTSKLDRNARYTFTAKPHKIRLVGPIVFEQLKQDGVLVVRTPANFSTIYQLIAGGLISAFFLVQLLLTFKKQRPDIFFLPVLLLLSGISMLLLFSIQDPVLDTLYAYQSLQGIFAGLAGYLIFCNVNIAKFYTRWWFDGLFNFRKRNVYQLKGWTWLVLAILLALITLAVGTGPEGSGVKVNIQLGGIVFQPGEITKYLLLVFLAAFFASTGDQLRELSDLRWRIYVSYGVFGGIAVIMALYLVMGDMGPAMVVCFTFLFFYSIARGNLLLTILSAMGYCLLLVFLPGWMATAIAFTGVVTALAIMGHLRTTKWWGVFGLFADAPVIVLLIIAAFAFGDQLPGVGDRLGERKAIWLSQWNNDVYGGDHLAHSYWTLSAGGFSGQGIGKGFSNTMPAAHTDMILPSIGEELGWLGLVSVFILFAILIQRSFLHARRSGQPFMFYLCAGIAIATGVQFLLIAAGSTGLMPLTGVAVPFLSYGKISVIINIAALGVIAGVSSRNWQPVEKAYIREKYDPVLTTGIVFFLTGLIVLSVKLLFVQVIDRNKYVVKQARVVMRNGTPVYSHNPRIDKLMRLLAAGNIYDRNGLLLATSEAGQMAQNIDSLQHAGLSLGKLHTLMQKRVRRFYPFGEQLFYWTGDYNTRLFWGQGNGYFAEARHLTALRGFGIARETEDSVRALYKPDRFTKPYWQTSQLMHYDYTNLIDALKEGIDTNSTAVRTIRDKDRNVQLSVDAALQTELQDSLRNSAFHNKRISVVVLDAASGDVLASALNPLPNLQSPGMMELPDRERNRLGIPVTERDLGITYATAPGSTIKILTAMAGFNKMGKAATAVQYKDIFREEIFRDNKNEQEPFIPKVPFVDMHEAIINSSNIFFIRLANEFNLEDQMASLYQSTGMRLNQRGGYDYTHSADTRKEMSDLFSWRQDVLNNDRRVYNNPAYAHTTRRYRSLFSGLAWGQSVLTATPISVARMAGAIANKGLLMPSRYVLHEAGQPTAAAQSIRLASDTTYAGLLKQYMIDQSSRPGKQKVRNMIVAGKTGTPERIVNGTKQSDGWYVFFAPVPGRASCTVTCIRIETGQSSANAVVLANSIAPILKRRSYIISF